LPDTITIEMNRGSTDLLLLAFNSGGVKSRVQWSCMMPRDIGSEGSGVHEQV
jgi:hypothetical protein